MNRNQAGSLAECIRRWTADDERFSLEERPVSSEGLQQFHQWADLRPCGGVFLVRDGLRSALWLLLIDWKRSGDYYLVLFNESRTGPLAEIHAYDDRSIPTLQWTYRPTKRDSRNDERRQYFAAAFLSDEVAISVPTESEDVADFFSELFTLVDARLKADSLDPDRPSIREGFPEGKKFERLHRARERNSAVVRLAKAMAFAKYGRLECACCGFNFAITYGARGIGFIEAHHTIPVGELPSDGGTTRVEDIALVCSNCHRMLHVRRPWLRIDELKSLVDAV